MDRVREQHYVGVRARVHPQRGSGEARVAKASDREDHASRRGLARVDIPAKAAQVLPRDRRIVRREQRILLNSVSLRRLLGRRRSLLRVVERVCPGCCGVVINSRVACANGNVLGRPASRSSKACAKTLTSWAVENTPACPATPPMRRAVVSCTVPQSR